MQDICVEEILYDEKYILFFDLSQTFKLLFGVSTSSLRRRRRRRKNIFNTSDAINTDEPITRSNTMSLNDNASV